MRIELWYFKGCPHAEAFAPRLRELVAEAGIDEPVRLRVVESVSDAERERFLGSPTLRVNGRDIESGAAERQGFGLTCRIYSTASGMVGMPPDDWVRRALQSATSDSPSDG